MTLSAGVQHSWYEEPAFISMLVIIYVMQIYWFVLVRSGQTRRDLCAFSHLPVCTDCSGCAARHPGSRQHRGRARGGQLEQGQEAEVKSELSRKTPASVLFFLLLSLSVHASPNSNKTVSSEKVVFVTHTNH